MLQTDVTAIAQWITLNLLCFNIAKIEFLLLGFKPQFNKIHNAAVTDINTALICIPFWARNVDFIIDAQLSFSN